MRFLALSRRFRNAILTVLALLIITTFGWHYRRLVWPLSGTTIVKVIAYGVIPLVLAWIGVHWAAAAVENPKRRFMYRAVLIIFAFGGIFLVALAEKRIDDEHNREIDGQRSAINSLIGQVSNFSGAMLHPPANPEHQQMTQTLQAIQGKLNVRPTQPLVTTPSRPASTEDRFRSMSDETLKDFAIALANRLRAFEADFRTATYQRAMANRGPFKDAQEARQQFQQDAERSVQMYAEHEKQFRQQYWADVVACYMELEDRIKARGHVPPQIPGMEPGGVRTTISTGQLSGAMRIDDIANYLEVLARAL